MIRNPWIDNDRPPPIFQGGDREVKKYLDPSFPDDVAALAKEVDFEIDAVPFSWDDSDQVWRSKAACAGEGRTPEQIERWYPKKGGRTSTNDGGLVWCQQCPVRAECHEFAEKNNITSGIWGGQIRHRDPERRN